ncbi:MAG: hypothetical protein IAE87_09365 [Rhodobacteraceae bacterium]|nr:hypothetical protein [Paracoccaceae bacterium]
MAQALRGQFRAIPGGVVGWDMTAALALAEALGLNRLIAAELLPLIEPYAVRGINSQVRATQHDETGS